MDSLRLSPLRRVALTAALAALLAPAGAAEAAKKKPVKLPVVTKVTPMRANIGDTLTIHGKYFRRGKGLNSVVFKREGFPGVFVTADISTLKQIKVVIPDRLAEQLSVVDGIEQPTRFQIRVLAKRFGKRYTAISKSPLIGPKAEDGAPTAPGTPPVVPGAPPGEDGDCDGDGTKNGQDTDDDNDLLTDDLERSLKLDQCKRDTDGDGVEDGYEYRSAVDLNDDEYQQPNQSLPYPGSRPFPNPLDATDKDVDFDGDALTLTEEYRLWLVTIGENAANRRLDLLTYSDGLQHSVYSRRADGRRAPSLAATGYDKHQAFLAWANGNGYGQVAVSNLGDWWYEEPRPTFDILDVNRSGALEPRDSDPAGGLTYRAEATYYDADQDSWLDDGERDEDADGLTNFDESHGCMMNQGYWTSLYKQESPYYTAYEGTRLDAVDSDGDGVRDGADDQDHDDIPNLWECSRQASSNRGFDPRDPLPDPPNPLPARGHVNPFNPCLPHSKSRTCNRNPSMSSPWAPFNAKDKYYFVFN